MTTDLQVARLRAMGELEDVRADIQGMAETLERVPLWRPAAGLRKRCAEALDILDRLAERFDRKLVVTLVGPSGSGKSTLLNALAGEDHLSPAGHRRPTTQQVVAFCRQPEDGDQLAQRLGRENIRIHARPEADRLENVILIDTPDTDSTHQERHRPIVHQAITLSDVLVCVFDAENPKRRDHTDFMAPYVSRFSGDSLVVAVNKCDRLDAAELTDTIMPEFEAYIREAWSAAPAAMLCISARSRLRDPQWGEHAGPRHGRNQFDQLQQLIGGAFNRSGFSVDRRLENARSLKAYIEQAVGEEARQERASLENALAQMAASEAGALKQAATAFRGDGSAVMPGVNVRLYQQLAQRWLGPVGWLVAAWTRILVFGTGIAGLLRIGNPVRQMLGAISSVRQYGTSRKAMAAADHGVGTATALSRYESAVAREWPDIAEILVAARFVPVVRDSRQAPGDGDAVGRRLSQLWNESLEDELATAGRRLSGGGLQLLFNLPSLAVMGYAGWLTATNFFAGHILGGDFFLHAFWTVVLVLLLSFFLLQGVIRLAAGKERLVERVFERVRANVDQQNRLSESAVWRQVEIVLGLGG